MLNKFSYLFKAFALKVDFDPTEYTDEVNQYFWEYGVRQSHADSFASGKNAAERRALFDKRYEALLAGDLRSARESDPLAREITKLAQAKANEYFASKNIKAKNIDADSWKKVMAQYRAHEPLIELAKVNVAAAESIPDLDIKL